MRILIVEDEYKLADTLSDRLKDEGYQVDVTYDGNEGYIQGVSGIYDVIVMDVMLPKMNGFLVVQKLRKQNINTPILMLTAKSEMDDKVMGFESGADDYLTKPFEVREFLLRVRALARRRGEIDLNLLTFGDLQVNVNQCEMCCLTTAQCIKTGAKELLILEFLMRNQKQVVTKEQIAEKIWGYDNEAEYNKVEVYLTFLRRKLRFIGSNIKIKAIRGIGYCLENDD